MHHCPITITHNSNSPSSTFRLFHPTQEHPTPSFEQLVTNPFRPRDSPPIVEAHENETQRPDGGVLARYARRWRRGAGTCSRVPWTSHRVAAWSSRRVSQANRPFRIAAERKNSRELFTSLQQTHRPRGNGRVSRPCPGGHWADRLRRERLDEISGGTRFHRREAVARTGPGGGWAQRRRHESGFCAGAGDSLR